MASMEGLLMDGAFSDSDSDAEDNASKAAGTASIAASTKAAAPPPVVVAAARAVGVRPPGSGVQNPLTTSINIHQSRPTGTAVMAASAPLRRSTGGAPPPAAASSSSSNALLPQGGPTSANNPNTYIPPMVHTHTNPTAAHRGSPQKQQHPQSMHGGSSARPSSRVPIVNMPSVGPPPPSPLTAANQQSQQQNSHGQQTHGSLASRNQQYGHAPHIQRGAGSQQQHHGQSSQHQQPKAVQPQTQPMQTSSSISRSNVPNAVQPQRLSTGTNLPSMTEQEKKRFLMFTKVLMKYLEQRDAATHVKAKATIEDCYAKSKAGDPQFKSLTTSMKARLRATVGEIYWKKAHDYLELVLKQKRVKLHAHQQQHQTRVLQTQQQAQQQAQQAKGGQVQPQQQPQQKQQQPPQQQQPIQQPQQQILSHSSSKQGSVPPPIVRTSAPQLVTSTQPQQQVTTQSQAAISQTLTEEEVARQKADERRAHKNAQARKRRAVLKKERLEAVAKAEKSKKATAPANLELGAAATSLSAGVGSTVSGVGAVALPTRVGIQHVMQQSNSVKSSDSSINSAGVTTTASSVVNPASVASTTSFTKNRMADPPVKKNNIKKKPALTAPKPPSTLVRKKSLAEEPSKLTETIDHAVLIDVKSIPNLLSKEHKLDFSLEEEQYTLLYGDEKRRAIVKDITNAASAALDIEMKDTTLKAVGVQPLPWKIPSVYDGWGENNVVSVRSAWAKVRLPEGEAQRLDSLRREKEVERARIDGLMFINPIFSAGDAMGRPSLLAESGLPSQKSLISGMAGPSASPLKTQGGITSAPRIEDDNTNHVWFNEARAEQDPTLALLSEATEIFLKSNIEKVIGRARLRQNLDGVRLWHTLHARSSANPAAGNDTANKDPPAALIRLGCDVRRQIALAEGNAAKTYQRMEDAISRQNDNACQTSHSSDDQPHRMLLEATSMSDLSKKSPLNTAAHIADINAKRKYAVFGGVDSQEPPFGRVPKKVKVMLQDIEVGELGNQTSMIRSRRKRFRVGLRY